MPGYLPRAAAAGGAGGELPEPADPVRNPPPPLPGHHRLLKPFQVCHHRFILIKISNCLSGRLMRTPLCRATLGGSTQLRAWLFRVVWKHSCNSTALPQTLHSGILWSLLTNHLNLIVCFQTICQEEDKWGMDEHIWICYSKARASSRPAQCSNSDSGNSAEDTR